MTMPIGELRYFAGHCKAKAEESRQRSAHEAVPIRMVWLEELLDQLARECIGLLDGSAVPEGYESKSDYKRRQEIQQRDSESRNDG